MQTWEVWFWCINSAVLRRKNVIESVSEACTSPTRAASCYDYLTQYDADICTFPTYSGFHLVQPPFRQTNGRAGRNALIEDVRCHQQQQHRGPGVVVMKKLFALQRCGCNSVLFWADKIYNSWKQLRHQPARADATAA